MSFLCNPYIYIYIYIPSKFFIYLYIYISYSEIAIQHFSFYILLHTCCFLSFDTEYSSDYTATFVELNFNVGDTKKCFNISVTNDRTCEADMNDTFIVSLTTSSGRINISRNTTEVVIFDLDKPECGT